jgi:hypothetical protein
MRRILVISVAALFLVACGGKSSAPPQTAGSGAATAAPPAETTPPPAGGTGEDILRVLRDYKVAVCNCKDAACVEAAQKPVLAWAEANAEALKAFEPTKEQEEEVDRIETESSACEEKIIAASGGGGTPAGPPITAAEILAKMAEFKNKVCLCKDKACIEKVQSEMMEWAMQHMESMKTMKPTKAEDEQADKIEGEMDACITKVTGKP